MNVHRYEELIAGRTYHIEVLPVSHTRWRAQIARLPGMPTALMPFYGPTPEAAAQELSRWLSLVYNGGTREGSPRTEKKPDGSASPVVGLAPLLHPTTPRTRGGDPGRGA